MLEMLDYIERKYGKAKDGLADRESRASKTDGDLVLMMLRDTLRGEIPWSTIRESFRMYARDHGVEE